MPIPDTHVFVCLNQRAPDNPKGCCVSKGAMSMFNKLKLAVRERMPDANIRINRAGCLNTCEIGAALVVYPEGVWYGAVTDADVDEIVESHLMNGQPVERLVVRSHSR